MTADMEALKNENKDYSKTVERLRQVGGFK